MGNKKRPINYCNNCGAKIESGEIYCFKCGERLYPFEQGQNTENRKTVLERIEELKENYDIKKLSIILFLVLSMVMNVFFMPWIRTFPDNDRRIKASLRGTTQRAYGSLMYMPLSFYDGYDSPRFKKIVVEYDYRQIAVNEVILGSVVGLVYLVITARK